MSESHTQVLAATIPAAPAPAPAPRPVPAERQRFAVPSLLRGVPASGAVWAGLLVAVLGFVVILLTWIKVARTVDVGLQMPYVVSGGMSGLGLIIVGVAIVDMAVRRQDRIERGHQMALMRNLLEELRDVARPEGHR